MDEAVQEYDGATQTWITPETVETPAPDPVVTPDPEDDAEPEAKVEPKAKPRNDPKARVEQATAKEAAAKRERDEAKAEAATLQARIAELEAKSAPKPRLEPPAADAEPTVDQFDSYEKFVDQHGRWAARQEWDQRERDRQEATQSQEFYRDVETVDRTFFEKYDAILKEDPDFESRYYPSLKTAVRLGAIPLKERNKPGFVPTLGSVVMEEVFNAQHPKEMLLYVSEPNNAQRLATLRHAQLVRELAGFDKSLGAASPAAPASPTPISHAKAPIRPVGSSPLVSNDEPGDDASDDEWLRFANAKLLKQRRAGRG